MSVNIAEVYFEMKILDCVGDTSLIKKGAT